MQKTSVYSRARTDPRIRVALPVTLRYGWKEAEKAEASTVDISARGLCVHFDRPLRLGMEVKAIFESAPDGTKVCRVVWVRKAESTGHGFDIGLELKA